MRDNIGLTMMYFGLFGGVASTFLSIAVSPMYFILLLIFCVIFVIGMRVTNYF